MSRHEIPSGTRLAWLAAGAIAGAFCAPAPCLADEPGSDRSFVFPEVQSVWIEAGEDGVKDWMRAMVKRSKRAGRKIPSTGKKPKCGSCHESLKTYSLSPDAVEDLRGLLSPDLGGG